MEPIDEKDRSQKENQQHRLMEIGQMTGGLIHDLNNHMMVILAHIELAKKNVEAGGNNGKNVDAKQELCAATESLLEAKTLIERTLLIIRGGRLILEKADLREVLDRAVTRVMSHPDSGGSQIRWQRHYDLKIPLFFVDVVQMERVFINLIRNAVQAMKESGSECLMRLAVVQDQDHVHVVFHDNGPGFPDSFIKGENTSFVTTRADHGGTGLGLMIAREIIQAHGGKLVMTNGLEGGAKFIVSLPQKETVKAPLRNVSPL